MLFLVEMGLKIILLNLNSVEDGLGVWPLNYFHHISGVTLLHALHAIPTNSSLPMDAPRNLR